MKIFYLLLSVLIYYFKYKCVSWRPQINLALLIYVVFESWKAPLNLDTQNKKEEEGGGGGEERGRERERMMPS